MKLFEKWEKHDKFQVELCEELNELKEVDTIKEYKILMMSILELWTRTQIEYDKIKDDIPFKYQFLIGSEILKKKDPAFWADYKEAASSYFGMEIKW